MYCSKKIMVKRDVERYNSFSLCDIYSVILYFSVKLLIYLYFEMLNLYISGWKISIAKIMRWFKSLGYCRKKAPHGRSPVNHSLKSICEVYYTSSKVFLLGVLYSNFTHHNIIFQESISQNILVWVLGWGLAGGSF